MKVIEVLNNIGKYECVGKTKGVMFTHVAWDTRLLRLGGLYVFRTGKNFDPIDYIEDIKAKASIIVAERNRKEEILLHHQEKDKILYVFVDNADIVSDYFVKRFSAQIRKMRFIGVTGTNGKTTVTKILKHIFEINNQKSAVIGTIAYEWGSSSIPAFMTTPDRENFLTLCMHMVADGVKNVFMEVSSHALVQGRIDMVRLDIAAFTNLSPEHLDYHKTMDEYAQAKNKIHDLLKPQGIAVVNADDEYSIKSINYNDKRCFSFGVKNNADYKVTSLRLNQDCLEFVYKYKNKKEFVRTNLIGYFNLENSITAIAIASKLRLTHKQIYHALKSLKAPCGRIEKIVDNVFVDYAHTSDALDKCLASIKELGYENIITVFGCGGNRDKSKRKLMGQVADKYSKMIIVTDDNPRNEDPQKIVNEIVKGIKNTEYEIVHDRAKAIKKGLDILSRKKDYALVIAGKGHETYQLRDGVKTYFSDQAVVRELCA